MVYPIDIHETLIGTYIIYMFGTAMYFFFLDYTRIISHGGCGSTNNVVDDDDDDVG